MSKYDRSTPFNDLPYLPPPEDKVLTIQVLQTLAKANRALGKLEGIAERLPNPSMLINTLSLQEAKSSSEIENIFTTEDELYKALADSEMTSNQDPATKEVLHYREALWTGYQHVIEQRSIDTDLMIDVFRMIKQSSQGIRPPQSQIVIRKSGSSLTSGEIVYTPPRGEGVLKNLLNDLSNYLNQPDPQVDPLIRMAIAHYQFEAIHPFQDENGRTGRILNILYLIQQGILTHPILYLSTYVIRHKDDYYHHLSGVTQRQTWEQWIIFMLSAVEWTADRTARMVGDILSQMDATHKYAKSNLKWFNKEVLEAIFAQPYIKPSAIGGVLGRTSRTTLTSYMSDLCRLGILERKKSGNQVYYINTDLVRILEGE